MTLDYIKDDITNNAVVSVVFPITEYPYKINELIKVLNDNYNKILYVSLNKLYNAIKKNMLSNKIDSSKFLFIDCVTKTAVPNPDEHDDCYYVSAPNSLTEISVAISKKIQESYPDIILFDSLSTILIYEDDRVASQFVHALTNKINAYGINILYTILYAEKEQNLIKDLNMFCDKVITIRPS